MHKNLASVAALLLACTYLAACGGHSNWEYKEVVDNFSGRPAYLLRTTDTNDVMGGQPRNLQVICDPSNNNILVWINTGPLDGPAYQTLYNTFSTYTGFDGEELGMTVLYGATRSRPEMALVLPNWDELLNSKQFEIVFMSTTGQVRSIFKTEGLREAIADNFKNNACAQKPKAK